MKPHPRIRKTIKWGGAAVTVLLVVVWIGSFWWWAKLSSPSGGEWRLDRGILVTDLESPSGSWTSVLNAQPPAEGSNKVRASAFGSKWHLAPIAVVAMLVSGIAWRFDTLARRLAKLHLCPNCGYDRTGLLQDAKCPECGSTPS